MVVGGSGGMTGAPMLAGAAAMRAGAGMVWCALPGLDAARRAAGSEVITRALPADASGSLAPGAADDLLSSAARFRAPALGPGLGREGAVAPEGRSLVARAEIPLVVDADGLNALADDLAPLRDRAARSAVTVLTPHDGEFARLAGAPAGADRVGAAR